MIPMTSRLAPALVAAWLLATAPHALAEPASTRHLRLKGPLVQGGLVVGSTRPGARVSLDGRELRVGDDGTFVFGLGRWAKPRAVLKVVFDDGREVTRTLQVRRRVFRRQRIDNLPQAMVTPPEELRTRILAEQTRLAALWGVDTPEPLFRSGFAWPARGTVTGVYGSQRILNGQPRQPHWGLDIAAPEGTPVTAPADGIVLLADTDLYYTGGTILLDHGFGIVSGFLHLSAIDVEPGQRVAQGEVIGKVGSTGRSTGPHLDWRVRWLDVFVDPRLLLPNP
jgi:murein DD-endopeptidase MepM/ murein hydrolase activator NlpD